MATQNAVHLQGTHSGIETYHLYIETLFYYKYEPKMSITQILTLTQVLPF